MTSGRLRFLWVPLLILTFTTPPAAVASAIQSTFGSSFLVAGVRDEFGALILLSLRWAPVALAILLGLSLTIPREQEWALRLLPPVKALKVRWQLQRNWRRACMLLLFLLMLPAAEIPSYAGIENDFSKSDGSLDCWRWSFGLDFICGPCRNCGAIVGMVDAWKSMVGAGFENFVASGIAHMEACQWMVDS